MANANIARVTVRGTVQGQQYRNIMHFATETTVSDTNYNALLLALAAAVMECFVSTVLPGLGTNNTIEGVSAKGIGPFVGDELTDVTGAGPGEVAGESLPSFCAQMVDVKTGAGTRKHRGRIFLPPPVEANQANSILTAGGLSVLTAFAACMTGKFIGLGGSEDWKIGVLSRAMIAGGSSILDSFKDATLLQPTTLLAVQGRRKIGRGA